MPEIRALLEVEEASVPLASLGAAAVSAAARLLEGANTRERRRRLVAVAEH